MKYVISIGLMVLCSAAFGQLSFVNVLHALQADSVQTATDTLLSHGYPLYKQRVNEDATTSQVYVVDTILPGAEFENYITITRHPKTKAVKSLFYACFSADEGKRVFKQMLEYGFEEGITKGVYHIKTMPVVLAVTITKSTYDFVFTVDNR